MPDSVYISGVSCISPCGLTAPDLLNALQGESNFTNTAPLGKFGHAVRYGGLFDFSEPLASFVKPLKRRKLSRLSRMAVTASGLALQHAGVETVDPQCGVVLGTAFGSTSQSELFYRDMLDAGFVKANPGLFPETVPNSPAGQVSITFGLHGPNTTICQQSLSSELALMTAFDLLRDGKLHQVLVIGIEEMSQGLLFGLGACGSLQKTVTENLLGKQMVVGEAVVGLLLESSSYIEKRNGKPLAKLMSVSSSGTARWPAAYTNIKNSVERVVSLCDSPDIDCVIPSASFIKDVDMEHLQSLTGVLPKDIPMLLPEYHTGALFGAGLLKQALGVVLLNQDQFQARKLGSFQAIQNDFYPDTFSRISNVYTSVVSAGGGCAGTIMQRVS